MFSAIEGKRVVIWTGDGPLNTSEVSGFLMGFAANFVIVDDQFDLYLVNIDKIRSIKVLEGSGVLGDPTDAGTYSGEEDQFSGEGLDLSGSL